MQTRQQAIEQQNSSFAIYFDGRVLTSAGKIVRAAKRDGVVSIKRCKELIEFAEANGLEPKTLKVDMTEYDYAGICDDTYANVIAGECGLNPKSDKFAMYNVAANCLQIWENGYPIYENNNGTICRDAVALADCLC